MSTTTTQHNAPQATISKKALALAQSRIGEVHGRLTTMGVEKKGKHHYMKCLCKCGREILARYPLLRNGNTKSCGCLAIRPSLALSHIGETYGLLTITGIERKPKGGYLMQCLCSCGKRMTATYNDLGIGKVKSCGCYGAQQRRAGATKANTGTRRPELAESHIGETHNRLTIAGVVHLGKRYYMLCSCACGQQARVVYGKLRTGHTKSCGCHKGETLNLMDTSRRFGWNFKGVPMRSGFEVMFATALDEQGIAFQYEPKCFIIASKGRYTPDFYVPGENCYYELKGRSNDKQQMKVEALRQQGVTVKMLFQKELEAFVNTTYREFQIAWCRANGIKCSYK